MSKEPVVKEAKNDVDVLTTERTTVELANGSDVINGSLQEAEDEDGAEEGGES